MAVTRLACPACGIAVPVEGPVAPQRQVTCPECRAAFPASQGIVPAQKPRGGGGGGMIVAIILCVVVGFGALAVLGAVAVIGFFFLLSGADEKAAPVAANRPPGMAEANDPVLRPGSRVGETAPDIVGEDTDGKPMKLSDYKGKVVVLDFWGHW